MQANFGKCKRLLTPKDYKNVFENNRLKIYHNNFLILAAPQLLRTSRLGIVVSKKNVKKAHDRNRIKRYFRETFRLQQLYLEHLDIIILAKKKIELLDNKTIFRVLNQSWHKLEKKSNKEVLE